MRQLTCTDLEELEARLRSEREGLLGAVRQLLAGRDEQFVRELLHCFRSGDSRGAAERLGDADAALLRPELAELEAIEAAMRRIDFGAGGLCIMCGNPIPLARLRAAPASLTCLECQQRVDAARAPGLQGLR